jgi:hypothetical protein
MFIEVLASFDTSFVKMLPNVLLARVPNANVGDFHGARSSYEDTVYYARGLAA